jgi:hypothetical protein
MNLGKALEKLKFDSRLQYWNLSQGVISDKDLKSHLQTLEDLTNRAAPLDLDGNQRKHGSSNGFTNGRLQ